jgi:hypothetical protein
MSVLDRLVGPVALGLALLPAACRFQGDDAADSGDTAADTDTDTDADTDTDTDADADTDTDTDADTDTGTSTEIPWIREVSRDSTTYQLLGVDIVTYAIGADNPTGYRDSEGGDPLFHVLRPATFTDPDAEHPVLMWLHGNAQGIEDDPDYDEHCGPDGIATVVASAVDDQPFIAAEIANRQWIWVVPENTWCDLWTGLGDADPVDTAHHGTEDVHTILDALETGFAGLKADPARIYGWGTSIGGAGILPVSYGDGGASRFAAVVPDSGPVGVSSWYNLPTEAPYLDHILGGAPYDAGGAETAYFDNYARVDGSLLLTEHDYRVPMFQVYNTYDGLVPVRQNEALATEVDALYAADGVRYFHHDVAHHAPGSLFHVQTGYERPPFSYTNRAAFDFLEGASVDWYEAEDTCTSGTCTVQAESGAGTLEASSAYSQGSAIVDDSTTPEIMYSGAIPANVPRGEAMTLLPVVVGEDMQDARPTDGIVTFELKQDGTTISTLTLKRGDLAAGSAESHAAYFAQVNKTTWVIDLDGDGNADPLPTTGALTIQAFYQGRGKVWLDGFWAVH